MLGLRDSVEASAGNGAVLAGTAVGGAPSDVKSDFCSASVLLCGGAGGMTSMLVGVLMEVFRPLVSGLG